MKSRLKPVNKSVEKRLLWKIFSNCLAQCHHATLAVILYLLLLSCSGNQKPVFNVRPPYK